MKKNFWIFLSLVVHLLLGALIVLWPLKESSLFHEEVIDLTLTAPKTTSGSSNALKSPATAPAQATPPQTPSASAPSESTNPPSQNLETSELNQGAEGELNQSVAWSEITRLPKVLKEVKAAYPADAKKAGVDGAVILEILIDRNGKVRQVHVVSGPGFGLNESAVEALKQFEFQPAQKGSENVNVKIRYTYKFKLGVN